MGKKARLKKQKNQQSGDDTIQSQAAGAIDIFSQKTFLVVLLFLIFTLGVLLRINNLGNVPRRSPDENIYTYQAKAINQHGTEGVRLLAREYNKTEDLWKYPPPIRIGYLRVIAFVMRMTNITDARAGAYVSCFFSVLSLLVLMAMGLRFFNRWITLYALLFMSVSPMALAVARRSWQEAFLGCVGFILIYLSCEITRATHKIPWYILFALVGSYCVSIKSTGVVIYGICIAWLFWVLFIKKRDFLRGVLLIALAALGVGVSLAILIRAVGGVSVLREILTHFKWGVETSEYARDYSSGPWYRFFQIPWMLSPLNTILFFVGSIGSLFLLNGKYRIKISQIGEGRAAIFEVIFFFAVLLAVLFITKEHRLNYRYVYVLNAPFYLLGGLGFWYLASFAAHMFKNFPLSAAVIIVVIALTFAAVGDYRNFKRIIVSPGIMDLSIRLLRESALR
ncbi:hypothetical protein OAA99_01410 [Omnitrophica bacterium]|nr:hypothetical protein [Candidatus Omnitrophota bacterium]